MDATLITIFFLAQIARTTVRNALPIPYVKDVKKDIHWRLIIATVRKEGSLIGIIHVKNAVRIAYHVIDQTIAQIAKKVLRNMPTDVEKFVQKTTRKDATTPVLKTVAFAIMKLEPVYNVLSYSF